jgi:hypothetical protein
MDEKDKDEVQEQEETQEPELTKLTGKLYADAAQELLNAAMDYQEGFRQYGMAEELAATQVDHIATGVVQARKGIMIALKMDADTFLAWWFDQIGEPIPGVNSAMTPFTRQWLQKGAQFYMTQKQLAAAQVQVGFMLQKEQEKEAAALAEAGEESADNVTPMQIGEAIIEKDEPESVLPVEGEVVVNEGGKLEMEVPLDKEDPIEDIDEPEA